MCLQHTVRDSLAVFGMNDGGNRLTHLDADGAALFDALFWNFVDKHQESLRKNMRTAQMVANWNRMLPSKKTAHLERAALYFQKGMDSL